MKSSSAVSFTLILLGLIVNVSPHGRLLWPPGRATIWRHKEFNSLRPVRNYDDHALNCGGRKTQYLLNHGKCGVCGDAYGLLPPRPNENGGIYGKGIIVGYYSAGEVINVVVQLTANHLGFFEFRLCPLITTTRLKNYKEKIPEVPGFNEVHDFVPGFNEVHGVAEVPGIAEVPRLTEVPGLTEEVHGFTQEITGVENSTERVNTEVNSSTEAWTERYNSTEEKYFDAFDFPDSSEEEDTYYTDEENFNVVQLLDSEEEIHANEEISKEHFKREILRHEHIFKDEHFRDEQNFKETVRQENQHCFDSNLLHVMELNDKPVNDSKVLVEHGVYKFYLKVQLPPELACSQCVLQWHYLTGNTKGSCGDGPGKVGCEETFRGCADISIS